MNIKDVKTWVVTGGVMVAKNPYPTGKYGITHSFVRFDEWASLKENQPATDAPNGTYEASLFHEPVWQWFNNRDKYNGEWLNLDPLEDHLSFEEYSNKYSSHKTRQFMKYKPLDEKVEEKESHYNGEAYYKQYTGEILDIFYHRFYEQYSGKATLEQKKEAFYEWLNEQIINTTY